MSKNVLIVDDSKTVRNLVAFILKAEGIKVTTAEDGLDGLEKLYSMPEVDLILTDINMPRMDGFSFIIAVREQDAYKDIPIIILSTEGGEAAEAAASGDFRVRPPDGGKAQRRFQAGERLPGFSSSCNAARQGAMKGERYESGFSRSGIDYRLYC